MLSDLLAARPSVRAMTCTVTDMKNRFINKTKQDFSAKVIIGDKDFRSVRLQANGKIALSIKLNHQYVPATSEEPAESWEEWNCPKCGCLNILENYSGESELLCAQCNQLSHLEESERERRRRAA